MSFFRSIVMLVSVALAIAFALFVGHGLAVHSTTPMMWGVLFLAAAAALVFLQYRFDGKRSR